MALPHSQNTDVNDAPEAQAFLQRVAALPKGAGSLALDAALAPSVADEAELRKLFAQDRANKRLANPYVGLTSVYDALSETGIRSTWARDTRDEEDRVAKHLFPLPVERRRKDGDPCVAESLDEFRKNWAIFTEGALSQLTDWNNVVAAGGSVSACLVPLSDEDKASRRTVRKYFHSTAFPTSDIDLFIWGLNAEQAEVKIKQIYEAVRDSVPWDVTCIRTKHAISIYSQYPYRTVQIVLRLYHSPAEILAGFDVDTGCVAYDGSRVLTNPRSMVAMMRQANTVDMTRRSPSYEVRLAKYAARGFEVYVPELRRAEVDPTIYERSLPRITGLARLLVLEKLSKPDARVSYLEFRRALRSGGNRPTNIYSRRMRRKHRGDLKADDEIAGLDISEYDVAQLHVPYGPGWNAKRIEKLVYSTDLGMNSTFNPKNKDRKLHRHVAFFGTMEECVEDLCGYCPEPRNEDEKVLQEEESKNYIRGRISFIEENPGRQSMTGSFNPIDVGEWSEQAYLGPTEIFFSAIATHDRATVQSLLSSGSNLPDDKDRFDVNRRDHVGRTALHVAILSGAPTGLIQDLINAGARITARLADGRTALHLAAYADAPDVVQALLARSARNEEEVKRAEEEARLKAEAEAKAKEDAMETDAEDGDEDSVRPSSEDDWSSDENDGELATDTSKAKAAAAEPPATNDADLPEDNPELPDVLDVNAADWGLRCTPLAYAILGGRLRALDALLQAGADPRLVTQKDNQRGPVLHPLSFAVVRAKMLKNADNSAHLDGGADATALVGRLVRGGATSAQADKDLFSIFHSFVCADSLPLVQKILESDSGAVSALNVPTMNQRNHFIYPIISAIERGNYALVALLVAYGAKLVYAPEDVQKAKNMIPHRNLYYYKKNSQWDELEHLHCVVLPAESALARHTYLLPLLTNLGAQVSVPIKAYWEGSRYNDDSRMSFIDTIEDRIRQLKEAIANNSDAAEDVTMAEVEAEPTTPPKTFAGFRQQTYVRVKKVRKERETWNNKPNDSVPSKKRLLAYYEEMLKQLKNVGAKTIAEVFPDDKNLAAIAAQKSTADKKSTDKPKEEMRTQYMLMSANGYYYSNADGVQPHQLDQYDALFEACWIGDNKRIEELCLPRKSSKEGGKEPIQIAVVTRDFGEKLGVVNSDRYHRSKDGCYNPFAVAVLARRWDTAKLVLAIATAQYNPPEQYRQVARLSMKVFILNKLEEDSDEEEEDEEDSDIDTETETGNGEINFIDLSTRKSDIQSKISPTDIVQHPISARVDKNGSENGSSDLLCQACRERDLETFVNIADTAKGLPTPWEPDFNCLLEAMASDSAEIVDEIIRRTGVGIDLEAIAAEEEENQQEPGVKPESKLYLGLTVHGKKRKDLAKFVEGGKRGNGNSSDMKIPLLWLAIKQSCTKVIEYLSGPSVLAAYRFYATTRDTEKAEALRKIPDLDQRLPHLLGVSPNSRRETALTAALLGPSENLQMVKKVLAMMPSQAKLFLHSSLVPSKWTPLHLATIEYLEDEVFDYLLDSGVSPEARDRSGMNILHLACSLGQKDLLEYFIKKLPADVISRLLSQKTYKKEDTPFMLAVSKHRLSVVKILLNSGFPEVKASLAIRNAEGSLPLHIAVRQGLPKITSALLATPEGLDTLHSENGVGETPLETATVKWFLHVCSANFPGMVTNGYSNVQPCLEARGTNWMNTAPPKAETIGKQLAALRDARAHLAEHGKFVTVANKKLEAALDAFAVYLGDQQKRLVAEEEAEEEAAKEKGEEDKGDREWTETADPLKPCTFEVVSAAVQRDPRQRRLVHLGDVQCSVLSSLDKAQNKQDRSEGYVNDNHYRYRYKKSREIPNERKPESVLIQEQWEGVLKWSSQCRDAFEYTYY